MPAFEVQGWRFHWKFWRPKECSHSRVYLGWWAIVAGRDPGTGRYRRWKMSSKWVRIKTMEGLIWPH
jgi:hypothetical protein